MLPTTMSALASRFATLASSVTDGLRTPGRGGFLLAVIHVLDLVSTLENALSHTLPPGEVRDALKGVIRQAWSRLKQRQSENEMPIPPRLSNFVWRVTERSSDSSRASLWDREEADSSPEPAIATRPIVRGRPSILLSELPPAAPPPAGPLDAIAVEPPAPPPPSAVQ